MYRALDDMGGPAQGLEAQEPGRLLYSPGPRRSAGLGQGDGPPSFFPRPSRPPRRAFLGGDILFGSTKDVETTTRNPLFLLWLFGLSRSGLRYAQRAFL